MIKANPDLKDFKGHRAMLARGASKVRKERLVTKERLVHKVFKVRLVRMAREVLRV